MPFDYSSSVFIAFYYFYIAYQSLYQVWPLMATTRDMLALLTFSIFLY